VRGFVKSYARAVGIDAEDLKIDLEKAFGPPVVAAVSSSVGEGEPRIPAIPALRANKPHPYTVQNQLRGRIAFAAILLVIVGVIVLTQYSGPDSMPVAATPPKPAAKKAETPEVEQLPADIAPPAAATEPAEEGALGEGVASASGEPPADRNGSSGVGKPEAPVPAVPAPEKPAVSSTSSAPVSVPGAGSVSVEAPRSAAPVSAVETTKKPEEPQKNLKPRPPVVAGFGARSVKVKSVGESWIIIYQDKKVVYDRLMRAGENLEYRFEGDAELTAGNPSMVEVTVDGQPAPPFRKKSSPSRIRLPAP
jgi:cytoskeletal protein RodZ